MNARQRKAKRSAAARKGWETRRARAKGRYIWEESPAAREAERLRAEHPYARISPLMVGAVDPNLWPRIAAAVRRWWARLTGRPG